MEDKILGLHHVTAIAGNAQRNLDFYTKSLGLRLVKKTVNFDDPTTYHLYYGDYSGTPGSILTFFPWTGIPQGSPGTGETSGVSFSVPPESLPFWQSHLKKGGARMIHTGEKFGEQYLRFDDPDGMSLELVVPTDPDNRPAYLKEPFASENAIRGFHHIVLTLKDKTATEEVLTGLLGYQYQGREGNLYRYRTEGVENAAVVDIRELANERRAGQGSGSIHHVAFRVKDDATQMRFHDKIQDAGFHITQRIDRDYFYSLYFREYGGVLFEIATDNPGFTVDEPADKLGTSLRLPKQHEPRRAYIEKQLPPLRVDEPAA